MFIGINHHPVHSGTAKDLERYDVVRYPVWNDQKVRPYQAFTKQALALGIRPLLVMDYRAIRGFSSYEKAFERQLKRYPDVEYWQIGNEPDQPDSESSWYMAPSELRKMLRAAADVLCDKTLVGPGLVSGNLDYLREVDYYPFEKIAIHPYGAFPWRYNQHWQGRGFGDIYDAIRLTQEVVDKPVWITEFGLEASAFYSTEERELYYHDMLNAMDQYGVEAALPYCHSEEQCGELALADSINV